MGEMADYTIESLESIDGYFENYMYEEETDTYYGPGFKKEKECKYCGAKPFYWQQTNKGWRLVDSIGKIHICERRK